MGDVEGFFLLEPAAELDGCPVELSGEGGIIDKRQDFGLNGGGGELSWPGTMGTIGEGVDALFVEASDPESQAAFAAPAVAQNKI